MRGGSGDGCSHGTEVGDHNCKGIYSKMDAIKKNFKKNLDSMALTMLSQDINKIKEKSAELDAILEVVFASFDDGFQFKDFAVLGKAIAPTMKLASSFAEYRGDDKKRFVTSVIWLLYSTFDGYPDGKANNIDIPFLMGGAERKFEFCVISLTVGIAVDAVLDYHS